MENLTTLTDAEIALQLARLAAELDRRWTAAATRCEATANMPLLEASIRASLAAQALGHDPNGQPRLAA